MCERGDLARGTTKPVVCHCTRERETVFDNVQPVHAVFRRIHSAPRSKCAHRFEIALSAIEKIAVQSKNDIGAIQFRNQPGAGPESALRKSHLLLTEEWFINAPAHSRKHFCQFSAQSFTCRRKCFANQERKTVPLLASNRVAKLSDV